jgi:hypothetical protein
MPRQKIEQVTVGDNPPGKFAGGDIFNIKFDIGYSQNLDKVTLSVVDGTEMALGSEFDSIKIGNTSFKDCYLISSEKSLSPGQNICNFSFTNKSFLLDKIFVGLVRRHCSPGLFSDGQKAARSIKVKANCPCNGKVTSVSGSVTRTGLIGGYVITNNLLCMGGEKPSNNGCDIPEVMYSVGNFIAALQQRSKFAIKFESGYLDYEVNYTGTVREVLSNICRDIAADFYFDWTTNTLIIYDLQKGIKVPTISQNDPYLASYSESKTIENTYETSSAGFSFTPGGLTTSNYSFSNPLYFTSTLGSELPPNLSGSEKQSFIGAILGKIDANARKLYFMKKGLWERIGLINFDVSIDPQTVFEEGFDVKTYVDFYKKFGGMNAKFNFFIEDPKLETYWQEQEEAIFNNYGRYFYSRNPNPVNIDECYRDGSKLKVTSTYMPDLNLYSKGVYYIEKEPTYCPKIEELFFYGDLEKYFPVYMDYAGQVRLSLLNALSASAGQQIESFNAQGRLLLALVPSSNSIPISAEFSALTDSNNNCEPMISNGYYINRNTSEDSSQDPCAGPCSASAEEEICKAQVGCGGGATIVKNIGHRSSDSESITITYERSSVRIKLPVRELFYGIETKDTEISIPFTSEFNFQGGMIGNDSIIPMKANLNTQDNSGEGKPYQAVNQTVTDPEKAISIKVIGIQNVDKFPLTPSQGLSSLSMYIDENGSFADLSYRSRAPELPSEEIVMQRIRPNKVSIRN